MPAPTPVLTAYATGRGYTAATAIYNIQPLGPGTYSYYPAYRDSADGFNVTAAATGGVVVGYVFPSGLAQDATGASFTRYDNVSPFAFNVEPVGEYNGVVYAVCKNQAVSPFLRIGTLNASAVFTMVDSVTNPSAPGYFANLYAALDRRIGRIYFTGRSVSNNVDVWYYDIGTATFTNPGTYPTSSGGVSIGPTPTIGEVWLASNSPTGTVNGTIQRRNVSDFATVLEQSPTPPVTTGSAGSPVATGTGNADHLHLLELNGSTYEYNENTGVYNQVVPNGYNLRYYKDGSLLLSQAGTTNAVIILTPPSGESFGFDEDEVDGCTEIRRIDFCDTTISRVDSCSGTVKRVDATPPTTISRVAGVPNCRC